ncbi:MAG TPA: FAD-dependent oxidoreductase [Caulobacteraceae bacterium]|nr:FAD-dependent oxidoreductase [Caulobacteraceae bacterium]
MERTEVLIVGAGPTGLALALWLTRLGIKVRIVDKAAEPGTTSRALAVQARTLELYRQLDLTEAVLEGGRAVPAVNLWARGRRVRRISFERLGSDLTAYPFLHIYPQDAHERLLIERLANMGVTVERPAELVDYVEDGGVVRARTRGANGAIAEMEAAFLAGCDGARSRAREVLGTGFPGGTYRQLFYVADVVAQGPSADGELHLDLDEADFLALFPLRGEGRARLIGTVSDERADADAMSFADVKGRAIASLKVDVAKVNWFSTYRVHHRVTARFRVGRVFLLGDAAHIHSPVGGQGMNTGVGDAINLAWKLAMTLRGRAAEALLDTYEPERIAFARRLVATTDRVFTLVNATGPMADVLRIRIFPTILAAVTRSAAARRYLFRTVSQITLNYRGSALSRGRAGRVAGGDRLPWAQGVGAGDNFLPLDLIAWQAHVYGAKSAPLEQACMRLSLPLHAFDWHPEHEKAGLARNALYVVRPDGYVGLAEPTASPAALERYFADLRFEP